MLCGILHNLQTVASIAPLKRSSRDYLRSLFDLKVKCRVMFEDNPKIPCKASIQRML